MRERERERERVSERERERVRERERERESRQGFTLRDFMLTQSSFILFKQIRDSKTSEHASQSSLSPLLSALI